MAQFELNIYGKDDEILKTFKTDIVRWGVFLEAIKADEQFPSMSESEQFKTVCDFMHKIFPDLTDADLEKADGEDVLNTFVQIMNKAKGIDEKPKNADGAAKK